MQIHTIHKRDFPAGLKEGDAIRGSDGANVFDEVETERVKKETNTMFDKMWG